ncbi:hypothetical protein Tco_0555515 [Tanacetum coccineum]
MFKAFNDCTVDYDKLERRLNETLGLLAQKEIDIKESLKVKAYEISVVKEKHDELVKQSLLTKSHYEGLVKEKTKVITDLKLKEEKDIDKMISMENQLKFLNEIVYKRSQSIQTIHMLAPKCPTFNGRPTFANPRYLKKAQNEIPCLYAIPHDQSDPANRLVPDREETLTLDNESRSKLNKDLVNSKEDIETLKKIKELRLELVANLSTYHLQRFKSFCYNDDDDYDYKESTIPLNEIISQIPPSIAFTPILPTLEPEDSFIMGNEELNTIPEKESDEVIKSSVENLVPIPSESEDTSKSDSDCDLPSCDDFLPLTDDESLSDEDVLEDNVKIYSNPLFKFNDEYISSDVNPLFDEVLENIESKDSYVSNFDEPSLLVTPLSDANEDECFNPGGDVDEIKFLLHRDPSNPKLSIASILDGFTDEPPF